MPARLCRLLRWMLFIDINQKHVFLKKSDFLIVAKAILLFFSALAINFILHELSHAVAAYLLHIKSTLFQQYVNPDTAHATKFQNLTITAVGPIFSLCLGLAFWAYYKLNSTNSARLFSLYAAIFGVSIFLGNLFATALGGDFHTAAIILQIDKTTQIILTIIGLLGIIIFMYNMGGHFISLQISNESSKNIIIAYTILLPVILGTAFSILVYLPLPPNFISNRALESLFWIFALVNAFRLRQKKVTLSKTISPLNLFDILLTISVIILVRIMSHGIEFNPAP